VTVDLAGAHTALKDALLRLRNDDGAWAYYAGRRSRLEPTCWALLGAGATADTSLLDRWPVVDGLLAEPAAGPPNLAFNALAVLMPGHHAGRWRLADRLVRTFGEVIPPMAELRQDHSLRGWPWIPGTFSWVEPTAWCTLALKKWRSDAAARARIDEAESVLRDRTCAGGGWNYGNSAVYGQDLAPHVPPTAAGLLALQDQPADPIAVAAADILERQAPREASTTALALSVLALSTVGRSTVVLATQLAAHVPHAIAFGNVAAMGMAAYALDCTVLHRRPPAFSLAQVR
jgi:hypothetical protein